MQIEVTTKEGASITVDYAIADTIAENVELYGEEVCAKNLVSALVLRVQGRVRSLIKSEKSAEEIHADMNAWKPGAPSARKRMSPIEKIMAEADKLSPEDRAAVVKAIRANAAGQKAAA